MNLEDHDKFLCRIAKTLYCGKTSSFDTVSLPLTELAAELYNEVKKDSGLDRLQVEEVAEFNQNACVSTCSLVLAILYLEKMKTANPEYIEKLVASKFLNDDSEEEILNSEWAICAGLSLKQVNQIEKKFLEAINWEIYVPKNIFWSKLLQLERYLADQEGKRRGWYSYTELNTLLCFRDIIFRELFKCYAMCCISYMASVLSMIGVGLLTLQLKDVIIHHVPLNSVSSYYCQSVSSFNATNTVLIASNDANVSSDVSEDINLCSTDYNPDQLCDNSSSACCVSNISCKKFMLAVNLPSAYNTISKTIHRTKKFDIIEKQLFYMKYA